jgi:hypothetical protein
VEPLKDLRAEAETRGETPRLIVPTTGAIITAGEQRSSGRIAEDHRLPPEVAARLAAAVPPNTRPCVGVALEPLRGVTRGPRPRRSDAAGGCDARRVPRLPPLAARGRTADDGRITQQTVYRVVLKRAAAAGVDVRVEKDGQSVPRQISAHSIRRGFVTAAFAAGADPLHVARHAGFTPGSKVFYRHVDESLKVNPAKGLLDPSS